MLLLVLPSAPWPAPVGAVVCVAIGAGTGHMAGKGAEEVVNPKRGDEVGDQNLGTGVGAGSGAATGAVGGPIGMAVGATVEGIAATVNPT